MFSSFPCRAMGLRDKQDLGPYSKKDKHFQTMQNNEFAHDKKLSKTSESCTQGKKELSFLATDFIFVKELCLVL